MFGKLLRIYRTKHKIPQKELARLSGVSKSTIIRIENGSEKAEAAVQAHLMNAILQDERHFRWDKAVGYERGEQLGLLLGTLPPEMSERLYLDIIEKLKDYVGFQINVDIDNLYPPVAPSKRKRKYMYYKFDSPIK